MNKTATEQQKYHLSIIVVSNYGDPIRETWRNERNILHALAQQDIKEPFEVLLVIPESFRDAVPSDINNILPTSRIAFIKETRSKDLINHAVNLVFGKLIAVIETDCTPASDWLRVLVEAMDINPHVSAVSGKIIFGDNSIVRRCLSLLKCGYMDLGHSGLTIHICNAGALYRRELLEQFPYPEAITPFLSSWMRRDAMQRNGQLFYFEPRAVLIHALDGWRFVCDLHRNIGYATMMMAGRKHYSRIPELVFKSVAISYSSFRRLGRNYLFWYDFPLTLVVLPLLPLLEIPGMIDALQEKDQIPDTKYN